MDQIVSSLNKLIKYIENESYKGYDPYDALLSPLFNLQILKDHQITQFFAQQFFKRFPFNIRPFLGIPKGYNPVTLGLCLQAYTNLLDIFPDQQKNFINKADSLLEELKSLIPSNFNNACWGYDFPWQARYANIPAWQPTVVATGIITNGVFSYYRKTGSRVASDLCKSASSFVINDLNRSYDGNTLCFSYSPFDKQQVYNASAKGFRLLSQVYTITRDERLIPIIKQSVDYILNRQNPDGSWYYSEVGKWIDNYHTGYILDCLHEYMICMNDNSVKESIDKGFKYYRETFFTSEGIPKLYYNKIWPVDCTSAGQSLLTLHRFQDEKMAVQVAKWMINNMQSSKGYFYYRKNSYFTVKTSFMRWSNAWMLAGLSNLFIYTQNS